MATDKEQLENMMAMAEQAREAQRKFLKNMSMDNRKDMMFKQDALDNLLKYLRRLGYTDRKIVSKEPGPQELF